MRKIWVILLTLFCCVLVTLGLAVGFLYSGRVQTAAVRFATEELSHKLNTTVRIGAVQYQFPMRITLNDIYIEDQQRDTLLYVKQLYTRFSPLALSEKQLRFPNIDMDGVLADVHCLPDGEYNYMFLVRAFASEDTTKTPLKMDIQLRSIRLHDIRARYDTFAFEVPEASLSLHHLTKDSIDAQIHQMAVFVSMTHAKHTRFSRFSEEFCISNLQAHLKANDTIIILPKLAIRLPNSHLDASGVHTCFPRKDIAQSFGHYFRENANAISMSLHVNKAQITPRDLKFFMKDFSGVKGVLAFSADLEGTLDSVAADNLELYYDDKRVFLGNFSAIGLPVLDSLYVNARCQDLSLSIAQIQDFVSGIQGRPFRLPPIVRRLGDMHYQGEVRGRLHDLTLHGAFRTSLGVLTTDGTCLTNQDFTSATITGRLATKRFNLGRLLAVNELETVALDLETDWHLNADRQPYGSSDATISEITFRKYRYKNIRLHANFDDKYAEGSLRIKDQNIALNLEGLVDFNSEEHHIDALLELERLCPGTLRLTERYPDSELSGTAQLHYMGSDIDHADIAASIDALRLRLGSDSVSIKTFKITSEREDDMLTLKLQSDYLTGTAKGNFAYTTLPVSISKQVARYLPSLFSLARYKQLMETPTNNSLTLYLYGHKIRQLQEMLQLPVMISDEPVIKGSYDDNTQLWSLQTYLPGLLVGNAEIRDFTLTTDNNDSHASLDVSFEMDSTRFVASSQAFKDTLTLGLDLRAMPPSNSFGSLDVETYISHYNDKPLIETHVWPSIFQLGDSVYHIGNSRIAYCVADTSLTISNFRLIGTSQYIEADGVASPRTTDSLHIALANINAGLLMPFLLPEKAFKVGGSLTGWANLFGVFSKPIFEAEVRLDSALMCDAHIGNAVAKIELDRSTGNIIIDGNVDRGTHRVAHVDGLAEPKKSRFLIDIFPDSIPLAFINHWTSGFLSDISGYGSGRVTVSGEGKKVWVITRVRGIDAGLTIPFTGCRYTFNDSVFMDSTSIIFPDITLRDEEGNPFYFNGKLTHDEYFRNFHLDLAGRCDHTLAINIPNKAGQFMQGKIYADGDLFIEGPDNDIMLTANAKAVGKSHFKISIDGASSAADNSFITFYDRNAKEKPEEEKEPRVLFPRRKKAAEYSAPSRFRLGLNIDIDPQTQFELVLNERTGDKILARGDGSIKFTMDDSTDEYKLMGTYTLLSGKMGFTIGNIIRRDFTIAEGSQIIWNGDPENPVLNVTARYQVTASLKDLFGTETENLVSGRTNVPVVTAVTLTGPLSDPVMRFDIELPKSEEAIASQIKSVINTDEMLMRQVVYLLVFGKFYTPEYMRSTTTSIGVNETYSLLSSTITGQINSWLSKITNVFTVGFNFRSDGEGSDSQQEYEAVFSLQPIDRLVINGNFGYRYNDISNRPFFGDLDIEYYLTPNGKVRLKGYTHTVDKYSLRQATMIEGVGVVFKHDFNWKKNNK